MNATIDGDMEVVSTLISDGVDINAVICEVAVLFLLSMYVYEVQLVILNQVQTSCNDSALPGL